MTTKKSQVRDVFTSAKEYYQALEFTTEEPQYAPMVHEFEAGLEVLDSYSTMKITCSAMGPDWRSGRASPSSGTT